MRLPCVVVLLLVSLLTGCATARGVRLEIEDGEVIAFTPRAADSAPVALDEDEFRRAVASVRLGVRPPVNAPEAARRLFAMEARGGVYRFDVSTRRMTPLESGAHLEVEPTEAERADPANIVRVSGHKGPHPKEYHQPAELTELARQLRTDGSRLNKLVTRRE
ncbi:hypothetical protein ACN469_36715 [Corallococcus terminator]